MERPFLAVGPLGLAWVQLRLLLQGSQEMLLGQELLFQLLEYPDLGQLQE